MATPAEVAQMVNVEFEKQKQKSIFVKTFCNGIDQRFAELFMKFYKPVAEKNIKKQIEELQAQLNALK